MERREESQSTRIRPVEVLLIAAWFGLVTGIGAVGLVAIKKFVLDRVTLIPPQVVWVSPVTFLLLALALGAVLLALARLFPRRVTLRVIVFVLAAAGCACGLLIWGKELHDVSVLVLSAGIAIQFAQLAHLKPHLFRRIVRTTLPILAGLVLLLGIAVPAVTRVREARAVAALPPARDGAPNVLWIILDTVRAWNTSVTGYDRPTTPNLERFAGTGITFERAISPASWTLPSHASMFTGRHVHELSTNWKYPLDATHPTIAEYLRDQGYRTGGIVGNYFYCNSEWGLGRGFLHYADYDPASLGHALLSTSPGLRLVKALEPRFEQNFWFHHFSGRRFGTRVSEQLLDWLERDRDRPFFAFVNFYDAHGPYVAPDGYRDRLAAHPGQDSLPVKAARDRTRDAPPDVRARALRMMSSYDVGIYYLDDLLGRLFDELERRGLLDNTLVIVTSDHGEEFSEHGMFWHGQSVYLPSVHVPLIIRLPDGAAAGTRVAAPVSLRDLARTTVDVLGLAAAAPFPGSSLARFWTEAAPAPEPVLTQVTLDDRVAEQAERGFQSVLDGRMHYIVSDRDREELFAYPVDPFEQIELSAREPDWLVYYRDMLRQMITPPPAGAGGQAGR
jgi:arylsulfatase A-like enzyme